MALNTIKYLTLVRFKELTIHDHIRTAAERAEWKSVVPGSWTFGRVGTQLEAVVGVGLKSFDES